MCAPVRAEEKSEIRFGKDYSVVCARVGEEKVKKFVCGDDADVHAAKK